MRVEILKPVNHLGAILRSGIVEAKESTARHWLATGAARVPAEKPTDPPPAPAGATAASSGKSKGL